MIPPKALDELFKAFVKETPASRLARISLFPEVWQPFIRGLIQGPDPSGALVKAQALPPELWQQPLPTELANLLHQGSYPLHLLRLDPNALSVLSRPPTSYVGEQDRAYHHFHALCQELRALSKELGAAEAIARIRNREYLHLAKREIDDASLEEIGGALSALSSACTQIALEDQGEAFAKGMVVFGMGKLGGGELNFLSDIDLIFVHDDTMISAQNESQVHAQRIKIHQGARKVVRLLEGQGQWHPLFRVDLRLRPFGSRGPVSISASGLRNYYERHGRNWERQVWLRAKPLAGAVKLGEGIVRDLRPFMYRRNLGPEIFDEVGALMQRARRDRHHELNASAIDLKHDIGGIREIEFFVQALQLMHGGRDPSLRATGTLQNLDALVAGGYIRGREHETLSNAYRFLRRAEHRLQLMDGQQTHSLPSSRSDYELFCRRLNITPAVFTANLEHYRGQVNAITATLSAPHPSVQVPSAPSLKIGGADSKLGHQPQEQVEQGWARQIISDPGASGLNHLDAFRRLGFQDPENATSLLTHLYQRKQGALSGPRAVSNAAKKLLLACVDSADPDAALQGFAEFSATRPGYYAVWRFLADEGRDELTQQIAELLGIRGPLSQALIGFPNHKGVADDGCISLLLEASFSHLPTRELLRQRLANSSEAPEWKSNIDEALQRFKSRELMRIGIYDLGRRPDPLDVGKVLSNMADLIVQTVLSDIRNTEPPKASSSGFNFAVFALGKYGMQSMDYGSDLDLLFVFEADDPSSNLECQARAITIARRLITRLQSRHHHSKLYEIDMRLRPSGGQGLLVSSRSAFGRYHEKPLPIWERLALLRARAICEMYFPANNSGRNPEVNSTRNSPPPRETDTHEPEEGRCSKAVQGILQKSLYVHTPAIESDIDTQVLALKSRIERELSRETRGTYNVKTGVGGCLELELLVAALQLKQGIAGAKSNIREIPQAIAQLGKNGVFDNKEVRALCSAYRFQRLLLNRLRMSQGPASSPHSEEISIHSPQLSILARRTGLPEHPNLIDSYLAHRTVVREAFYRHLSKP